MGQAFRSSLKQLIAALDHESLDDEWDDRDADLEMAVTRRNFLAHEFFVANVFSLANEVRARGLLAELDGFVQAMFVVAHRNPDALPSSPFDPAIPEATTESLRSMGIEVDIPDDS